MEVRGHASHPLGRVVARHYDATAVVPAVQSVGIKRHVDIEARAPRHDPGRGIQLEQCRATTAPQHRIVKKERKVSSPVAPDIEEEVRRDHPAGIRCDEWGAGAPAGDEIRIRGQVYGAEHVAESPRDPLHDRMCSVEDTQRRRPIRPAAQLEWHISFRQEAATHLIPVDECGERENHSAPCVREVGKHVTKCLPVRNR